MASASFQAGTIATILRPGAAAHARRRYPEADELEQAARSMSVGVLVQDALPRATPHLLRLARIGDELPVRGDRLVRGLDHDELRPRLEPALDAVVRVRHDRRARGGELERARGGRGGTVACGRRVMFRLTRALEIARAKTLNGMSPSSRARPDVALEVEPAERDVELRRDARRLTDHRLHPVAAELVPVAVEEDVDLLLDGLRREELRIRGPEERLAAARAEVEQPLDPALGVGEHEVVLRRVGSVVRVEARVHAAELGQAHRHVPVVEEDGDPEPLSERRRDARGSAPSGP